MAWHVGDRARLGRVRGGEVIQRDGKLRVSWPDGSVGWLDHCVPDEGPDGPVYEHSLEHCEGCGNLTISRLFCVNCERRAATFQLPDRAPVLVRIRPPAPGVHVAGEPDRATGLQCCVRCKAVLKCSDPNYTERAVPGGTYPVGALIERGRGWQAMSLSLDAVPTCEESIV